MSCITLFSDSSDELSNSDVHREGELYGDGSKTAAGKYLIIHYATLVCPKTSRWRVKNVALYNAEQRIVDHWYSRLTDDLRGIFRYEFPSQPANQTVSLIPVSHRRPKSTKELAALSESVRWQEECPRTV